MMSTYLAMSAWREILARVFEGFTGQDNVTPEWLVNPATRRRLKLDKYYPEAGIAIRFVGLTAKGQSRQSEWELLEAEQRDQTRAELCRLNGVQLVTVDPAEDLVKQLDGLLRALSRTSRSLAQGDQTAKFKAQWMPVLATARDRGERLRASVARNPEQMVANLAEAWRDREAGVALELSVDPATPEQPVSSLVLSPGQRVRHSHFGEGVIVTIEGSGGEAKVAILFDAADERTFQANLLYDKLEVLA
ncbi:MAG: hypothetical protein H3C34_10055 [Caldilineaceae bacterium]|nr:hypothetical protein [Caldilineaceae bacterium]